MERENMRIIISKRMIREGLLRCLQKKKFENITITELCREAQVNRTTFYNHYQTPKDVLDEISWEIVQQIEAIFQKTESEENAVLSVLKLLQENKDMLKIIFSASTAPSTYKTVIQAFSHFWNSSGDLKNRYHLNEDELKLTITGYGWAGYHMLRQWILEDIDMSPEKILALFEKIFIR